MPLFPVADIVVKERLSLKRKEAKIENLADSISRNGLFHPVVVDRATNELVAGERRLEAFKLLAESGNDSDVALKRVHPMMKDWEMIPVTFMDDLDGAKKLEIELEENIQREDIEWTEVVAARERLHELKVSIYGRSGKGKRSDVSDDVGWRLEDTATSLGLTAPQIVIDLTLARALKSHPELGKISTKYTAFKVLKAVAEKEVIREIASREKKKIEESGESLINCLNGDCLEIMAGLPDNCIDIGIVDPPFGIGDDLLTSGEKAKECDFSNDPEECISLYSSLVPILYRIMKPGTHCYLFFAVQFYQTIRDMCEDAGFEVRRMPLVWVKESGRMTDIDWKFMPKYEVLFFMAKPPSRPLNRPTPDAFIINREATIHRIHPMERPRALIREFLEISSHPGEMVLDPFAGSFVTPHVCKEMGMRCIAIELNEDYFNRGLARLKMLDDEIKLRGGIQNVEGP